MASTTSPTCTRPVLAAAAPGTTCCTTKLPFAVGSGSTMTPRPAVLTSAFGGRSASVAVCTLWRREALCGGDTAGSGGAPTSSVQSGAGAAAAPWPGSFGEPPRRIPRLRYVLCHSSSACEKDLLSASPDTLGDGAVSCFEGECVLRRGACPACSNDKRFAWPGSAGGVPDAAPCSDRPAPGAASGPGSPCRSRAAGGCQEVSRVTALAKYTRPRSSSSSSQLSCSRLRIFFRVRRVGTDAGNTLCVAIVWTGQVSKWAGAASRLQYAIMK